MTAQRRDSATLPHVSWDDPAKGTLSWQSLFSRGETATDSLTCGVATIRPGEHFAAHRHAQAEVYFGLEGRGIVVIDAQPHELSPGVALFIPGNAEHGIPEAHETLRWFYTFAADSFDDITYRFSAP
ncbi:cupin domain-containing protein [Rhodobacteraceae bacterium KMS-5]|uniref:Cupin domain-containing protein n=2 Tax=Tabrizicola oligotrophica TaxID=2710650 RepID=A0A6M0QNT7_9RHOB|nr:cupin domain-containing protein [Tabrizicola oligotrophica]